MVVVNGGTGGRAGGGVRAPCRTQIHCRLVVSAPLRVAQCALWPNVICSGPASGAGASAPPISTLRACLTPLCCCRRWPQEGRVYGSEEIQGSMRELIAARHAAVVEGGHEIGRLLATSSTTLKIDRALPAWCSYVGYVAGIVVEGLAQAVVASASQLLSQIDVDAIAKADAAPLVEVQLELSGPELAWRPDVGDATSASGSAGMRAMINGWLQAYTGLGALVLRLDSIEGGWDQHLAWWDDTGSANLPAPRRACCCASQLPVIVGCCTCPSPSAGDYSKELEGNQRVQEVVRRVRSAVLATETRCEAFRQQFTKFESLWKCDMHATLQQFLALGPKAADGTQAGQLLERFEAEIGRYRALQDELQALPSSAPLGWIKVDAKPIKQALLTWASKWIYLYTHHLQSKVNDFWGMVWGLGWAGLGWGWTTGGGGGQAGWVGG